MKMMIEETPLSCDSESTSGEERSRRRGRTHKVDFIGEENSFSCKVLSVRETDSAKQ